MRLDQASKNDVSRALEQMLAAGMAVGRDLPQDADELLGAYWLGLRGVPAAALVEATEGLVRDGPKWLPAANEIRRLAWEAERRARVAAQEPTRRDDPTEDVERVTRYDADGPIVRRYPGVTAAHLPIVASVRCPAAGCECAALEVWVPGFSFGAATKGWALRWTWSHLVLARNLPRLKDHPRPPEGTR